MSDGDLKCDVAAHAGMVTFGVGYMAYFSGNPPGSSILGLLIVPYAVVCAVCVTGMLVSRRGGSDE